MSNMLARLNAANTPKGNQHQPQGKQRLPNPYPQTHHNPQRVTHFINVGTGQRKTLPPPPNNAPGATQAAKQPANATNVTPTTSPAQLPQNPAPPANQQDGGVNTNDDINSVGTTATNNSTTAEGHVDLTNATANNQADIEDTNLTGDEFGNDQYLLDLHLTQLTDNRFTTAEQGDTNDADMAVTDSDQVVTPNTLANKNKYGTPHKLDVKVSTPNYKPNNLRLLPIATALASQSTEFRKFFEPCVNHLLLINAKICKQERSLDIFHQHKHPGTSEDTINEKHIIDNVYIPSEFRLTTMNLKIPSDLLEIEDTRNAFDDVLQRFSDAKRTFMKNAGLHTEQVAQLGLKAMKIKRMKRIVTNFWHVICILIDFYRIRKNMIHAGTNRSARVLASCIIADYFTNNLHMTFFDWLGQTCTEAISYAFSLSDEITPPNPQQNIPNENPTAPSHSILHAERPLVTTILTRHIHPIFLASTQYICEYDDDQTKQIDDEKHLKLSAKKRTIDDLSKDTNDAIHNTSDSNHAQAIVSMMRKENNDMKKTMQAMVNKMNQITQKNMRGGHTNPHMSGPQQNRGNQRTNNTQRQRTNGNNGWNPRTPIHPRGRQQQRTNTQRQHQRPPFRGNGPTQRRGAHGGRPNGGRGGYRR